MLYTKDGRGCCEGHPTDKICGICGHTTLMRVGHDSEPYYTWECRYCAQLEREKKETMEKIVKKDYKRISFFYAGKKYYCSGIDKDTSGYINKRIVLFKLIDESGVYYKSEQYYYLENEYNKILIDGEEYKYNTEPAKKSLSLTYKKCQGKID